MNYTSWNISWEIMKKKLYTRLNETGSMLGFQKNPLYLVGRGQDNDLFEVIRKDRLSNCFCRP